MYSQPGIWWRWVIGPDRCVLLGSVESFWGAVTSPVFLQVMRKSHEARQKLLHLGIFKDVEVVIDISEGTTSITYWCPIYALFSRIYSSFCISLKTIYTHSQLLRLKHLRFLMTSSTSFCSFILSFWSSQERTRCQMDLMSRLMWPSLSDLPEATTLWSETMKGVWWEPLVKHIFSWFVSSFASSLHLCVYLYVGTWY